MSNMTKTIGKAIKDIMGCGNEPVGASMNALRNDMKIHAAIR